MRILLLVAVLLVTACGVQPTGVIPGLPAPRIDFGTRLFFVQNGRLFSVTRTTDRELSPVDMLKVLAAGPTEPGVTTEVPADLGPVSVNGRTVTVSVDVASLSTMAVDQIVCTAPVDTVTGQGQTRGPERCPLG
jgi:hypothetical protein